MTYIDKLISHYGNPITDPNGFQKKWMTIWNIPDDIIQAIPCLPHKLYLNKDLVSPLEQTLRDLISKNLHGEITHFDGIFCIRVQRGSNIPSTHAFALAVDLNAHDNPFGHTKEEDISAGLKPFSDAFLQVWRDCGFIDGADFCHGREDGMHFEWSKQFT